MSGIYAEFDIINVYSSDFNFIDFIKKKSNKSPNKPYYFTTNKKENITIKLLKNPYFDLRDLLKNNPNLSETKIKRIEKLEPSSLFKVQKSSLGRSFCIYHLSEEDLSFLKSGQKIHDDLLEIEKEIKTLIPNEILMRQKELEKQKRQYFK